MASIFYVRHQAAGVVHEFPFAASPNEAQLAAVAKLCFQRFGASHPKTPDEPYWVRVVEVPLLDASDVPEVPDVGLSVVSLASLGEITASGVGHVENPSKSGE